MTEIERTVEQIIVIVEKSVPSVSSLTTQTVIVKESPLTRAATVKKVRCVCVCVCVCVRACVRACVCVLMSNYYRLKHSSDLHYVMKIIQAWNTTSMPSSITAWL